MTTVFYFDGKISLLDEHCESLAGEVQLFNTLNKGKEQYFHRDDRRSKII